VEIRGNRSEQQLLQAEGSVAELSTSRPCALAVTTTTGAGPGSAPLPTAATIAALTALPSAVARPGALP